MYVKNNHSDFEFQNKIKYIPIIFKLYELYYVLISTFIDIT